MGFSRPHKRRKLTSSSTSTSNVSSHVKDAVVKPITITAPATTATPSCVSCRRALKAAQGLLVICARCSAPTCAICSRTCTACPSSMPPTPHLTRSPTPEPSTSSPPSPKRLALALHSANTNRGEKRRNIAEGDSQEGFLETLLAEFYLVPGCGRTVCRNCCTEDNESASAACHDCMGHY